MIEQAFSSSDVLFCESVKGIPVSYRLLVDEPSVMAGSLLRRVVKKFIPGKSASLSAQLSGHEVITAIDDSNPVKNKWADGWVVLKNNRWLTKYSKLVNLGYNKFIVVPSYNLEGRRGAIKFGPDPVYFLPNYKVLYSSVTEFVKSHYKNLRTDSVGHILQNVDFCNPSVQNAFTFTILRDPYKRFGSLFGWIEKNRDNPDFHFMENWISPVEHLSGREFSKRALLDVIAKIPDSHADHHFVSQHYKTHFEGRKLVTHFYTDKNLPALTGDILKFTGIDMVLPVVNSSNKEVRGADPDEDYLKEQVKRRYEADIRLLDEERLNY